MTKKEYVVYLSDWSGAPWRLNAFDLKIYAQSYKDKMQNKASLDQTLTIIEEMVTQ